MGGVSNTEDATNRGVQDTDRTTASTTKGPSGLSFTDPDGLQVRSI
jgi:hypothetical protein